MRIFIENFKNVDFGLQMPHLPHFGHNTNFI